MFVFKSRCNGYGRALVFETKADKRTGWDLIFTSGKVRSTNKKLEVQLAYVELDLVPR